MIYRCPLKNGEDECKFCCSLRPQASGEWKCVGYKSHVWDLATAENTEDYWSSDQANPAWCSAPVAARTARPFVRTEKASGTT
ncbi:hypothetical protein DIPPA_06426 [Diplonema papillatum]|nr:hypothetical protein DIPPA_06426 [Diplonema papillatum]